MNDEIHYVLAGYRFIGVDKGVWIKFYEKYGVQAYANIIKTPNSSNQRTVVELIGVLNIDGSEALFKYTKKEVEEE